MNLFIKTLAAFAAGTMLPITAFAQSTVVPLGDEPAPRLIVEQPLPGPLAQGVVYIPYRVENLRILPLGGAAAATFRRGSGICTSPSTICPGNGRITVRATPSFWSACRAARTRC
jgi:hypothetical protein